MVARLPLKINHVLISAEESDDTSIEDKLEDKGENKSRNGDKVDENSVMSDNFSFNLQNTLESDHSHGNVDMGDTSKTGNATIEETS